MKHVRKISRSMVVVVALCILLSSCTSTRLIQSTPSGAKVYMNEEYKGTTPYSYRDTKIVGSSTSVRVEKEGYKPVYTTLVRNEEADAGAIIGGVFFLVPFLWTMKYAPVHNYELGPAMNEEQPSQSAPTNESSWDKAEKLRELKSLKDDGIITDAEFEKEKQKILNE